MNYPISCYIAHLIYGDKINAVFESEEQLQYIGDLPNSALDLRRRIPLTDPSKPDFSYRGYLILFCLDQAPFLSVLLSNLPFAFSLCTSAMSYIHPVKFTPVTVQRISLGSYEPSHVVALFP